jgi:hypothetical protein
MRFRIISLVSLLLLVVSCTVNYTTKSGTAPTEAISIYIPVIYNEIGAGPSNMSQEFTELLREYFQRNTKLDITKTEVFGELMLEGAIVGYNVTPVSPSAGENGLEIAAQNRLTMLVKMKYANPFNKKDDFEQVFSYFKDFDGDKSLSEVESELLEEIYEQLIIQIFTKSFDNW